jgi:hypothetical protein
MSENHLPDPFQSAKRISGIHVHLRPADLVTSHAATDMEAAKRLLDRHGGTLAAAMLSAALNAAIEITREEGGES